MLTKDEQNKYLVISHANPNGPCPDGLFALLLTQANHIIDGTHDKHDYLFSAPAPKVEDGNFILISNNVEDKNGKVSKEEIILDKKYINQNSKYTFLDLHPKKDSVQDGKLKEIIDKDGNLCGIPVEINDHHFTSLELADNHKQLKVAPSVKVMNSRHC